MTINSDKTITISLDSYFTMENRALALGRLVEKYEELSRKYDEAMEYLKRLAPMESGVALQTADGLMCYMPGPIEPHRLEIERPIRPSVEAMRVVREDLDFDKVRTKCRVYRMTWQTTAHGLRIYEEVTE